MNTLNDCIVRLIASAKSWIEGEAIRQLYAVAKLEGVCQAIGFPDLHPGKGTPVGAAFVTEDVIYPHLIGNDIGCGMGLWKTDLLRQKVKLDRWDDVQFDLEVPWHGDVRERLELAGQESTAFDTAFGTLGGGNHFAEFQAVEKVASPSEFERLGLSKNHLVLLVHSGSRGLGESVFRSHAAQHRAAGVDAGSAADYLAGHDLAVRWAKASRALIAERFASALGAEVQPVLDIAHNWIQPKDGLWVHRKGGATADEGPVVIAGSRGTHSYLVLPKGASQDTAWSLAHGSGRKYTRSASKARVRERFRADELTHTPLGGRVICEDRDLLYEEAPMVYKNIETVIADLEVAGLIEVIATLRPVLTYKTRSDHYRRS
ncbi:MAG TPA: RNA ligase RtcB family protein [Verrucomicrobiae bacterium]|nr:RNA ligase RtcB family protein [Verrucomicrobiae bacterium]